MNNNLNLDENTMNNIKNMVDNGNISEAISQISPEMIQNISNMINNNSNKEDNSNSSNEKTNQTSSAENNSNGINFNNIDPNTIMKVTSAFGKMNNSNDPRANLLYSLKPYLRDGKKEKLDQYVNLLNVSKIAEIMKDDKKEN